VEEERRGWRDAQGLVQHTRRGRRIADDFVCGDATDEWGRWRGLELEAMKNSPWSVRIGRIGRFGHFLFTEEQGVI
jgi:hypothetical protein